MIKKYKKHTTGQLRKKMKVMYAIAISVLFLMCFLIGMAMYQIKSGNESATFTALAPAILAPLMVIPLAHARSLSKEIERRKSAD